MKRIEKTHLYQEIHEQPDVIRRLINNQQDVISALVGKIKALGIHHIFIAARGSSDNAGRFAKYLMGAHNHLVISLATPSLFTIYKQPPDLNDSLVLGISQSGRSPDIVSVLKEGQKQGALTAAITNATYKQERRFLLLPLKPIQLNSPVWHCSQQCSNLKKAINKT